MTVSRRAASISGSLESYLRPVEQLPWYHRFVINWLITDPNQFNKQDHKKITKNYQAQNYKGTKYIFLFGGRWRTLKYRPINVGAGVLILVPAIVFWAAEAKWWWTRYSPSVVIVFTYVWVLCFALFTNAAVADPGTLPRNLHIPGNLGAVDGSTAKVINAPDEYFNTITLPHKRDSTQGVTVKYCTTCHIWRPPRCHHCSKCNCCVLNHDHHCVYLNNCVGARNSKAFYWFLLTSTVGASFIVSLLFVHMFAYRYQRFRIEEERRGIFISNIHQSLAKYPTALFLVVFTIPAVIYPLLLLIFHIFLTAQNLTTREYLNEVRSNKSFVNVYNTRNILHNLYINWLGKSHGVSLMKNKGTYDSDDQRFMHIEQLGLWENRK